MTEPSVSTKPRRQPSTVSLAIMITLSLLSLAALGWVWFTRYAPVHLNVGDATITDARAAAWIAPLLGLGVAAIGFLWLIVLIRARWDITPLPIVIGIIGVLALVLSGRAFWIQQNASQPIRIIAYSCDADTSILRSEADGIPAGCEVAPDTGSMTIGMAGDPGMEVPDETDSTASAFPDLPRGRYDALLTASAQPETATVVLAAETSDGLRPVSRLAHAEDRRWTGTIALHPNLETYALLMYESPYPAAPEATIRFTVQSCIGTSLGSFDASACEPTSLQTLIIEPMTPSDGADNGRPPYAVITNDTLVFTNLEQRSYTFAPSISLVGTGILVIPAEDTQTTDRNILQQEGAPLGTFTIDITDPTHDRVYTVYLLEEGVTFASASDMRP